MEEHFITAELGAGLPPDDIHVSNILQLTSKTLINPPSGGERIPSKMARHCGLGEQRSKSSREFENRLPKVLYSPSRRQASYVGAKLGYEN